MAAGYENGIAFFQNADLEGEWTTSSQYPPITARTTNSTAFDRDEISAPSLISANGVLRVYYSARRGRTWRIGLIAYERGEGPWRYPMPILSGSGEGHDALGVRDPSALQVGTRLDLYYTGLGSLETRLGQAVGDLP